MAQDDLDDTDDSAAPAPQPVADDSGNLVAKAKRMTLILSAAALAQRVKGSADEDNAAAS